MQEIEYICCFCNMKVESDSINPCDLNILINFDKSPEKQESQNFWCHFECFKEKLHKNVSQYLAIGTSS